jgi:hypothetical protein
MTGTEGTYGCPTIYLQSVLHLDELLGEGRECRTGQLCNARRYTGDESLVSAALSADMLLDDGLFCRRHEVVGNVLHPS